MDEFEYRGDWWLPQNPDNDIAGVLAFSQKEGLRLELDGAFTSFDFMAYFRQQATSEYPIILGISRTGIPITLYKCEEVTSLQSGRTISRCLAKIAIVGQHFQRVADIKFPSLTASFAHLPEWVGLSGFRDKLTRKGVSTGYQFPKPIVGKLTDMTVEFGVGYKSDMGRQKRVIEQTGYIQLRFRKHQHIDECEKLMLYTQEFLTLGMSQPTVLTSVTAKRRRTKTDDEEASNRQIQVYFATFPTVSIERDLYSPLMLFTLGDIQDDVGAYLQQWFSKASKLRPVFDLYFSVLFSQQTYSNWVFLNYIQAIEAYDRRVAAENQYVTADEFTPIWEQLVRAIPQDKQMVGDAFHDSLKQRMRYMYEYSLKKRLRLILKKHKDQVAMLIPDIDPFIDDVVTKRNHLTHWTEELEHVAVKGDEFRILIQRIRFLIEVSFLSEIGIPPDKITQIMQRSSRYQRVLQAFGELLAQKAAQKAGSNDCSALT